MPSSLETGYSVEAKLIFCQQCSSKLAEHYGKFILIQHRGLQARFYQPAAMVVCCRHCGQENALFY